MWVVFELGSQKIEAFVVVTLKRRNIPVGLGKKSGEGSYRRCPTFRTCDKWMWPRIVNECMVDIRLENHQRQRQRIYSEHVFRIRVLLLKRNDPLCLVRWKIWRINVVSWTEVSSAVFFDSVVRVRSVTPAFQVNKFWYAFTTEQVLFVAAQKFRGRSIFSNLNLFIDQPRLRWCFWWCKTDGPSTGNFTSSYTWKNEFCTYIWLPLNIPYYEAYENDLTPKANQQDWEKAKKLFLSIDNDHNPVPLIIITSTLCASIIAQTLLDSTSISIITGIRWVTSRMQQPIEMLSSGHQADPAEEARRKSRVARVKRQHLRRREKRKSHLLQHQK